MADLPIALLYRSKKDGENTGIIVQKKKDINGQEI